MLTVFPEPNRTALRIYALVVATVHVIYFDITLPER